MINNGQYYLVTSDAYFIAPDGQEYRAAWGKCYTATAQDVFGFTPQRPSTNWFCSIGEGDRTVIIAGCQIHYAVASPKRPYERTETYEQEITKALTPVNKIWFTE